MTKEKQEPGTIVATEDDATKTAQILKRKREPRFRIWYAIRFSTCDLRLHTDKHRHRPNTNTMTNTHSHSHSQYQYDTHKTQAVLQKRGLRGKVYMRS